MNKEQFKKIISGFVVERLVDALTEQAEQKGYFNEEKVTFNCCDLSGRRHRVKISERNFGEYKAKIKETVENFSAKPDEPLGFVGVLPSDGTLDALMKQQAKIRKEMHDSMLPPIEYASRTEFEEMSEYQKKCEFVERYLEPLIKMTDFSVKSVAYTSDNGEYVTIRYRKSKNEIRVCVGGDSLAALTRDVMKKI